MVNLENYISIQALAAIAAVLLLIMLLQQYLLYRRAKLHQQSRIALQEQQSLLAGADATAAQLLQQLQAEQSQFNNLQLQLDAANKQIAEQATALAVSAAEQEAAQVQHTQQIALLEDARKQLKLEFENLANRIFEEKANSLVSANKQRLDQTLTPLREQLSDFKRKVEDVYDKESKERLSLLHEIGHLKSLNQQISQDAINLTKALKSDTKVQGNWGEVVLQRVLEESGLRKGHEYETQVSLSHEGGTFQPDVIVHLPDNKDIIIDAKVSLLDYERYCSAENDSHKQRYLKAHLNSMRAHLKGISTKNYERLDGITSLDFILIFVPIEPAFLLAFEQDAKLFSDAYERGVIIVSPTTLLAVLRTIQSLWRYDRQNQNADEIARIAGTLYDKIAGVAESLLDVGKHLESAQKAQETTLSRLNEGRGNLVTTAKKLEKLGAKSKKPLPNKLTLTDDNEA